LREEMKVCPTRGEVDPTWLKEWSKGLALDFIIRVKGDSMNPPSSFPPTTISSSSHDIYQKGDNT